MSHYSAIGDTISCDAPYGAIGFRGKFFLRCPPSKACLWIAIGHFYLRKEVGSDSLRYHRSTVRQVYCYTCLAMGGVFRSGHKVSREPAMFQMGLQGEVPNYRLAIRTNWTSQLTVAVTLFSGRFQGGPEACARLHAKFGDVWRSLANPMQHSPESPSHIHQSFGEGHPHSTEFLVKLP